MSNSESPKNNLDPILCVGIGASAGGLEALEAFFEAVDIKSGAAFIVVQHLSPDYESRMEELLARRTEIPVQTARSGQILERDNIYLLPPKKEITVNNGMLYLEEKSRGDGPVALPISYFFESLAADYRTRAVAVVLSGTGSDGSRGGIHVSDAGGLVVAQDPATAKFDGMPTSMIDTGRVDVVGPPDEVWGAISRFRDGVSRDQLRDEKNVGEGVNRAMQQIVELLQFEHEIDFNLYKPATVRRRIHRRADILGIELAEYIDLLSSNRDEVLALYNDLLIGVTEFFRDKGAFDFLRKEVIPEIIDKHRSSREEIRVWGAGCATGEEIFSIAILFDEAIENQKIPIKLFATDVHRTSLEIAGRGVYSKDRLKNVSPERLSKYFVESANGYAISERIRKMVVFAHHDIVKSAPFTRMDLVICRNLLIYLRPPAQKRAISLLHFGLKKEGILFLGSSETLAELESEFDTLDRHWRFFRKRRDVRLNTKEDLGGGSMVITPVTPTRDVTRARVNPGMMTPSELFPIYDRVLSEFMPPGIVVDHDGAIIHSFEGVEVYFKPHVGRPSNNLFDHVREEIRPTLRSALQRAVRSEEDFCFHGIGIDEGEGREVVSINVTPLRVGTGTKAMKCYLIRIEKEERAEERAIATKEGSKQIAGSEESQIIADLEFDLNQTRESLQATVEELETSNEELQATNEELVASNEELQSTNEELHSVNEEIHTVNTELRSKVTEVSELSADMEALFESTDVGVVFLDPNLRIRRFTPQMAEIFHLVSSDEGRLLEHFSHNLQDRTFLGDARRVVRSGETVEREIRDYNDRVYLLRILPHRVYDSISGVIIVLVDFSSVREAEQSIYKLADIVGNARAAIVSVDMRGIIDTWNPFAGTLFGYDPEEAIGKDIRELVSPEGMESQFAERWDQIGTEPVTYNAVWQRKDGHELDIRVTLSPIRNVEGEIVGRSAFINDITDQARALRRLSFKNRVSEILSTSESTELALGGILKAMSSLGGFVAGEFWTPSASDKSNLFLEAIHSVDPTFVEARDDLRTSKDGLSRDFCEVFFDGECSVPNPRIFQNTDEVTATLVLPEEHCESLRSILIFPAVFANDCEGYFLIYYKKYIQDSDWFTSPFITIGLDIGRFLASERLADDVRRSLSERVFARFDSEGIYTSAETREGSWWSDAIGKSDRDFVPHGGAETLRDAKQKAITEGVLVRVTIDDGSSLWEISIYPDDRSEASGGTLVADEITHLQRRLRRSSI